MSLIHDALKKAGGGKKPPKVGSGMVSLQEPGEPTRRPPSLRTMILAVLLVAVIALSLYLRFSGRKEEVKFYQPAVPLSQTSETSRMNVVQLKSRAAEVFRTDDFDAAWSILSTASRLDDKDPEIWNNLGLVASKRGDVRSARESYQKALQLKPEYPEVLNNLAVMEMRVGNHAEAKKLLDKALELAPAYPEANFHMALLHDRQEKKDKAIEYYKRFLEVSGDYPSNVVDAIRDRIVDLER